jgi:hypothetical protein
VCDILFTRLVVVDNNDDYVDVVADADAVDDAVDDVDDDDADDAVNDDDDDVNDVNDKDDDKYDADNGFDYNFTFVVVVFKLKFIKSVF